MSSEERSDPGKPSDDPRSADRKGYDFVADKVGGVPNIRAKDNLIQGAVVLVFGALGAGMGMIWGGLLLGLVAGIVAGALLSGAVLMVIGLVRKS